MDSDNVRGGSLQPPHQTSVEIERVSYAEVMS